MATKPFIDPISTTPPTALDLKQTRDLEEVRWRVWRRSGSGSRRGLGHV